VFPCLEIMKFVILLIGEYICFKPMFIMTIITQRLKKVYKENFLLAEKYYGVLSVLNSLNLTERELQLMAFIATKGSVSIDENRKEFCKEFSTTAATINNMVSRLKKKNLLTKKDGQIVVNSLISLDFRKDLQLEIKLSHEA
jgi:RNase P subunit RPR2